MKAMLMHVGADSSNRETVGVCGPIFDDNKFEFIPILESEDTIENDTYSTVSAKSKKWGKFLSEFVPADIKDKIVHNDPDFVNFTYSDPQKSMRAKMLTKLEPGDFLFFVASLVPFLEHPYLNKDRRTIKKYQQKKMSKYVIGFFEIEKIINCEKDNSELNFSDSRVPLKKILKRIKNNAHAKRKFDRFTCAVGRKTCKSALLSEPIRITCEGFPFKPTFFAKQIYGNVSYPRGFKIITNEKRIKILLDETKSKV